MPASTSTEKENPPVEPLAQRFGILLNLEETARRLGLRTITLRAWAAERRIAKVRLGRRILIPESEIERLLEENFIPALPLTKAKKSAAAK